MSQSAPTCGASVEDPGAVASIVFAGVYEVMPPYTPQNQESRNGRGPWAPAEAMAESVRVAAIAATLLVSRMGISGVVILSSDDVTPPQSRPGPVWVPRITRGRASGPLA